MKKTLMHVLLLLAGVWLMANATHDPRTGPAAIKFAAGAAILAGWHCLAIGRGFRE